MPRAIGRASSRGSAPLRVSRSRRLSPDTSSIAMYNSPSASPTSYTVATRGCTSAAAERASLRKRARRCGSLRFLSRSTFSATGLPSCSSSARYTIPIPPRPSSPRTTNRPRRPPLARAASGASITDSPSMRAISRSRESSESAEGSSSTSSRPPGTIEPPARRYHGAVAQKMRSTCTPKASHDGVGSGTIPASSAWTPNP